MFLLRDRLVNKLSFREADIEAEQPLGACKARMDALQDSIHVGDEGSVFREEEVPGV